MATAAEMQARYNEIASGLLDKDLTGAQFGHNQIGLNKQGQFSDFDLRYKNGDASSLKAGGSKVAGALNSLAKEYGLDLSKVEGTQVGDYEALGSVRYDPGAGVKRSERAAFDEIFNKYLKGQWDAKATPGAPPKAAAPPAGPSDKPQNPLTYNQPAPAPGTPTTMQRPRPPVGNPNDAAPVAPANQAVVPPTPNRGDPNAPGWQGPEKKFNDVPTGPSLVNYAAQTSAYDDPMLNYLKPVYSTPTTDQKELYDQIGLDLMSRYGMDPNGEHNFFPNRTEFNVPTTAPAKYT